MVKDLLKFLDDGPTSFLAIESIKKILKENDYNDTNRLRNGRNANMSKKEFKLFIKIICKALT